MHPATRPQGKGMEETLHHRLLPASRMRRNSASAQPVRVVLTDWEIPADAISIVPITRFSSRLSRMPLQK
jgi:hypothetical protein